MGIPGLSAYINSINTSRKFAEINETINFVSSDSQPFTVNPIEKGITFDDNNSMGTVEMYDNNTLIFIKKGRYVINYRMTFNIHDSNLVSNLNIRPSVHNSDIFPNYSDFGINTFSKTVQTNTDTDLIPGHETNTINDTFIHTYDGGDTKYFKIFVWGPTNSDSYIQSGVNLNFTYLGA